ncbi:MAG: 50S ribosomal protein L17 [Caldiserica bacterium]|jgi:large subunit ribosomal protein L17|nr:50S ribosomal protein L17 [Caldisericota bacterium]MCX6098012.1 50S ribosomal protein L17 [Caldisericota bacterium]
MRHGRKLKKLGVYSGLRSMMLRNLSTSVIEKGRIETTVTRAKSVKRVVEKLITTAKVDDLTTRRKLHAYLLTPEAVDEAFKLTKDRYITRPGGYLRIIKAGYRKGDAANMAVLEFVEK